MKKILKAALAVLLVLLTVFPCGAPILAVAAEANAKEVAFASTINALKQEYPHGNYWNEYNGKDAQGIAKAGPIACTGKSTSTGQKCTSRGYCYYCTCDCGYYHGWQCFGFGNLLAYKTFGSWATNNYYASGVNKGWSYYKSVSEYYAGDFVRTDNNQHTIFIYKVDGNYAYYADCNNKGACQINWEGKISLSSLKKKTSFVVHKDGNTLKGTATVGGAALSDDRIATDFYANVQNGTYTLKSVNSGKYMGVQNSTNKDGTNILTYDYQNADAFKFYIEHAGDGKYLLYSLVSKSGDSYGRVLDVWTGVYSGTPEAGDRIDIFERTSTEDKCQLFYLVPQSNGSYVLELVSVPGLVVASKNEANAKTEGGAMTARVYRGYTTQQWYLCDESGARVDASIDAPTGEGNDYSLGVFRISEKLGLNIRTGPGTKYTKVGAIPYNVNITISDVDDGWGRTSYRGVEGWVCMDYVERAGVSSNSEAVKYKVTADIGLRIRENAGTEYNRLGVIPYGKEIWITTIKNGWGYTTYGEISGWVSMDYVEKVTSSSSGSSGSTGSSGSSGNTGSSGSTTSTMPTDEGDNLALVRSKVKGIDGTKISLKGPSVDFLGDTYHFINVESELKLDLGCLKIIYDDSDGKTLRVLVGYDEEASLNLSGEGADSSYWKNAYKQIKSIYKEAGSKTNRNAYDRFRALRKKLKANKAKMLVEANVIMGGYLEFEWTGEEFVFSEGGVIATFEVKKDVPGALCPGITVGVEFEAKVDGSLGFATDGKGNVIPSFELTPELITNMYLAPGGPVFNKFLSLRAGLYGKIKAYIKIQKLVDSADAVRVEFSGGGYLEAKLLSYFSTRKDFPFGDPVQIYPNKKTAMLRMMAGEDVPLADLLNEMEPINRGYLNAPTVFSLRNADPMAFEKSYVYPNNGVSLVSFDGGKMMLVWIEDTGEKTTSNVGTLAYSFFDGERWSETTYLFEEGTGNDSPVVYSDGTRAYILWHRATEVLPEDATASDAITKYDLFATVFNSESGELTDPIRITENALYENGYQIVGKDGDFTVLWLENSENHLEDGGVNTIYTATYSAADGALATPVARLSTEETIGAAALWGDRVFYTLVTDDELQSLYYTLDDETVLLCENVGGLQVVGGTIFYTEDGVLKAFDGDVIAEYPVANLADFKIVSNGTRYYLFAPTTNEQLGTDLYYCTLDPATHTATGFELYAASTENYISDYSPVVLSDGTLKVAFNYILTESEEYKIATIKVADKSEEVDFVVDYVDFEDADLVKESFELQVALQNNSSVPLESFIVDIYAENGDILASKEIECPVDAFGEGTLSFEYSLPEGYNNERLTFTVTEKNNADHNMQNNSVQTTLECLHSATDEKVIVSEPTTEADGEYGYVCEKCGGVCDRVAIPRPSFSGASLTLQNNLQVNFKANETLFTELGYADPYVVFEMNGVQTTVSEYTVKDGKYTFAFKNIAPNRMKDTIRATLYATYNGNTVASATREYSVDTYCYSMLTKYASDDYAKLRTLLVDLLNYGTASQIYTGYKLDDPINAELTEEQALFATQEDPALESILDAHYETVETKKATWRGAGLLLNDSVALRFKLAADSIEGLSVRVVLGSHTFNIPAEKFLAVESGVYYVYFKGLTASQLSEAVYVTVYEGDEAVSDTVRYSVESYAYEKQNASDEALATLVKAMMKYGKAAQTYANEN